MASVVLMFCIMNINCTPVRRGGGGKGHEKQTHVCFLYVSLSKSNDLCYGTRIRLFFIERTIY